MSTRGRFATVGGKVRAMTRLASVPLVLALLAGCARPRVPDPRDTMSAYAAALADGNAGRVHAMLSDRSRRAIREDDVARMIVDAKAELAEQARSFAGPGAVVRATARLRYSDGEDATLDVEDGEFRLTAADGLPAVARSPEQALGQFRRALARRSYAWLVRVLSPRVRSAIESDLGSLVDGLRRPDGLEVHVSGDSASVQIPGGHHVTLRRDGGSWRVEDFD
jgi:hypothetical protein